MLTRTATALALALLLSSCATGSRTSENNAGAEAPPAQAALRPPTGVPFSPHFMSYASLEETQAVLASRDYAWKSLPNELVAEHTIVISAFEVSDYIHLGFHGKAVILFSNDRLMLFEFFPGHPDKTLKAYQAAAQDYDRALGEADAQAGNCSSCRIFGPMQSQQTGAGFVWADGRLVAEAPQLIGLRALPNQSNTVPQ